MGADLILADISIQQVPTKVLWKRIGKALNKKVDKMTVDELQGWADEIGSFRMWC